MHGADIPFMCFVRILQQTAAFTLYIINWFFITKVESAQYAICPLINRLPIACGRLMLTAKCQVLLHCYCKEHLE